MLKAIIIMSLFSLNFDNIIEYTHNHLDNQIEISISYITEEYNEYQNYLEKKKEEEYNKLNYFNGESKEIIAKKINKYLNSTLKGKGEYITNYSLKVGLDPYLAAAVMLQETGCYWTCSKLTRNCNNVGGNKGKPSCNGGSYRKFNTIEDGIKFAINKLNSYYKKGLKTPKQINPYYASDKKWHEKVQRYMNKIKKVKVK